MSKVVLGLFLHLIGSYGIFVSSTRILKNLFKVNVALFVPKEMYFSCFTFLKSLFISKKKSFAFVSRDSNRKISFQGTHIKLDGSRKTVQ